MLNGKNVVIGVCGGIACYKMCNVVSGLKKLGANVDVIMTKNACEFVTPLTFETLAKSKVVVDMFEEKTRFDVEHISLAKKADIFVIAPATANIIGKMVSGIADDMLSTTVMATKAPIMIFPSMNTNMLENVSTVENLEKLEKRGVKVVSSDFGMLACGDEGKGKLPDPERIINEICDVLAKNRDYKDKKVLVTCGATMEDIDGVRFITNHSSGKMGIEIAKAFFERGAQVTLVVGKVTEQIPQYLNKIIHVKTTINMFDAVIAEVKNVDIIVKAAAPADYACKQVSKQKIKSETLTLEFVKNPDIAKAVGEIKGDKKLIVFCAETNDLIENAKKKIQSKNADLIIANDVTKEGAGFNVDTNIITVVDKKGNVKNFEKEKKSVLSHKILDEILKLY